MVSAWLFNLNLQSKKTSLVKKKFHIRGIFVLSRVLLGNIKMSKYLSIYNGVFTKDCNLILLSNKEKLLREISKANQELITHDPTDDEIDVSDIPPSLLFAAINNAYSSGFMLYIPLDITFFKFIENNVLQFRNKKQCSFVGNNLVDFEYLHAHGKIKSSNDWDCEARKLGYIWDFDNKSTGTIKSIVTNCRKIYRDHLNNI